MWVLLGIEIGWGMPSILVVHRTAHIGVEPAIPP
jgi:hypothetical protein